MKSGIITRSCYNKYVKCLRFLLNIAERNYFVSKLANLRSNPKKNWKVINGLMNRNPSSLPQNFLIDDNLVSSPSKIADSFNLFFTSKPEDIHKSIPASSRDYIDLVPRNSCSMFFEPCSIREIERALGSLNKQGCTEDLMKRFLMLSLDYVASLLAELFNECLSAGIFPNFLKTSRITPIYKKGPKNDISNYRPVSILVNVAKIFESLIS